MRTAVFDEHGALANFDEAVGELVNTYGVGGFTGYYNDPDATAERMRHGMYWSGDLAYRDADGWIYLAGRTADWMRVDGENLAAGPIERILQRLPQVNQVAVYAVPDEQVGDQVMAALVLNEALSPKEFEEFLAAQADLSPKAWPRYVRINTELPADRDQQDPQARAHQSRRDRRGRGAVGARGPRPRVLRRIYICTRTGQCLMPVMNGERSRSGSPVAVRSGMWSAIALNIRSIVMRARLAPMQ